LPKPEFRSQFRRSWFFTSQSIERQGFVSGHGFSRAGPNRRNRRALAPGSGERGRGVSLESESAGAKAQCRIAGLAARLKPCPDTMRNFEIQAEQFAGATFTGGRGPRLTSDIH